MRYVCIALVVNHAAGRAEAGIHAQMDAFLDLSMERLEGLLKASLPGVCAHAAG
jgi:hypothetical protein